MRSVQGEEFDDVDYRSVEDYGHDTEPRHDDDEEDEKLLEELEDKQLLARIAAIEAENHNLKEQVIFYYYSIITSLGESDHLWWNKVGTHSAL